jgi:hypothetical protein
LDEHSVTSEVSYSPDVTRLAVAASDTLYDLCDLPAGSVARWAITDTRSLQTHFNFEELMSGTRRAPHHVSELVTRYHVALPIDEAERGWLFDQCNGLAVPEQLRFIRRQETTIVSRGLHRVVYGRDLLRRWSSWRRQTSEFVAQGTVDVARESLRELIETVLPGTKLPSSYLALRSDSEGRK